MRIAPSLASAPTDRLGDVVRGLDSAGADLVHFDIEDGVFVPVMTLGIKLIADLRPLTALPFDVHLMMVNPEWLLPQLAGYGANRVSVHYEACPYPRRTLRIIRELGISPGIALNPATALPDLAYLRPYLDFVLILTTEPEIPDAPFLAEPLEKVRQGKAQPGLAGVEWVVDGGFKPDNAFLAAQAGADTLVVGRAAFQNDRLAENLSTIRAALER